MNTLLQTAIEHAPAIISALPSLLPPSSQSTSTSSDPVHDDRLLLANSALPPAPSTPSHISSFPSSSSVKVPFQYVWFGLDGTESKNASITIPEIPSVKKIIAFFRDAKLVNLEAAVYPHFDCLEKPITVDLMWSPSDTVPSGSILNCPGAVCFTVGGQFLSQSGILPCDLNFMNPIIKSPIPYTNHPRLNAKFYKNQTELQSHRKATIIIRGIIACAHPTVYA
ncbi:hypothetical protein [Hubei macula-like virus 2]|uniref:hypothetical protein n=1 Tax=Hubei macula-like virus 2 TaxID=1922923 RepID=UPI00090C3245|nr:hypothetical protein [Hubei macula-like virus 2]APG77678.1 hypothetical protein [Hubei macula-like virus 2]